MRLRVPRAEARRLAARLTPTPAALEQVGQVLLRQVHNRYESQGASGGRQDRWHLGDTGAQCSGSTSGTIASHRLLCCPRREQEVTRAQPGGRPESNRV